MKKENKNNGILINFIIILIIVFIGYFSNIKSLLEVYNFSYKAEILNLINDINIDTTFINDTFNNIKKSLFINTPKEVKDISNANSFIVNDIKKEEKKENITDSLPPKDDKIDPLTPEENIIEPKAIIIKNNSNEILEVKKIMIAGDSVAQSLEYGLKFLYPKKIENHARHSTGLTVPSYYDWEKGLREYLSNSIDSNVLIFMVGANDAQDLYFNKKFLKFGSQEWKDEYKSRVIKIIDTINEFNNIQKVIWIGQPIMRSKNFDQKMEILNSIYLETIQEKNDKKIIFLPTRELFSINGEYSAEIDKKVARASDGIHLGMYGTEIIAAKIKASINN